EVQARASGGVHAQEELELSGAFRHLWRAGNRVGTACRLAVQAGRPGLGWPIGERPGPGRPGDPARVRGLHGQVGYGEGQRVGHGCRSEAWTPAANAPKAYASGKTSRA